MKRSAIFFFAFAVALYFGSVPLPAQAAQGGFGGGGRGPGIGGGEEKGGVGKDVEHGDDLSKEKGSKSASGSSGKKTASDLLTQNSKLSSNLQKLLPGTNLQSAASGFDHLGQFVAAVHVSHNLGIPFDKLRARMLGGDSLGEAIHSLKPSADSHKEAIKANEQALHDMEQSMATTKSAATR